MNSEVERWEQCCALGPWEGVGTLGEDEQELRNNCASPSPERVERMEDTADNDPTVFGT